jgi:4-diphosphocytidyl-2-C-methyl-D-erythritol kinase
MTAGIPERVRVEAPSKLNLFLHVGNRRPDGFHELQSLVAFAEIGDTLELESASSLSLEFQGPFANTLRSERDNLILKAARALAECNGFAPAASMTLTKRLPVASGIGGGSADAAAALRGLAPLWGVERATPEWAARIGSDVPVCLLSRPAWMEGRGESVTPIGVLPNLDLVLVNPGVSVSTAEIFRRLDKRSGATHAPRSFTSAGDLLGFLDATRNDLEQVACEMVPEIATAMAVLGALGANFVRMSGSGATCYGVFQDSKRASAAARAIALKMPSSWWVVSTRLSPDNADEPIRLS